MQRVSAGLLMYRLRNRRLEVLLAHPGGPFFARKDDGAWSIPKGEPEPGEDSLVAAQREFEEETGFRPSRPFRALTAITQKGGKVVHAWAVAGDYDPRELRSNLFQIEWPPRSGRTQEFPEVDRVEWFALDEAKRKIKAAQIPLLEDLSKLLKPGDGSLHESNL